MVEILHDIREQIIHQIEPIVVRVVGVDGDRQVRPGNVHQDAAVVHESARVAMVGDAPCCPDTCAQAVVLSTVPGPDVDAEFLGETAGQITSTAKLTPKGCHIGRGGDHGAGRTRSRQMIFVGPVAEGQSRNGVKCGLGVTVTRPG